MRNRRHARHGWLWNLLHRPSRPALVAPFEHVGATVEHGIGKIPAARSMKEIALDGASPDELRAAALNADPYEQLVVTHRQLDAIEAELRADSDRLFAGFMAQLAVSAAKSAAAYMENSAASWQAGKKAAAASAWRIAQLEARSAELGVLLGEDPPGAAPAPEVVLPSPLALQPWTQADFEQKRTGTTFKAQHKHARGALNALKAPTMTLPVIELHEVHREAVAA